MKFDNFKRVRRPAPNPKFSLRLHRAEYGSSIGAKVYDEDNYYPDSSDLIKYLSKFHKVSENNLIVGLGGESLIKDIFIWHSQKFKKKNILNSSSNYFMYTFFSKLFNYKTFSYDLDPSKKNQPSVLVLKKIIKKNKINLLVLVNPSSPIEKVWTIKEIFQLLSFCEKANVVVVIDEVYQLLGAKSAINSINKFNNVIILRSFSKAFGFPGLRLGYTISSLELKNEIESFRLAIELPSNTIKKSIMLIKNFKTTILRRINTIKKARSYAHQEFKKRKIKAYGKYSNSVCFKFNNEIEKKLIAKKLKEQNIYIQDNFKNHLEKYASIATTNIKNIKFFFKNLDNIKK